MITRLAYLRKPLSVAPFSTPLWGKSALLSTSQVEYFKSLKLHHSQNLVSEDENGAEFSYRLVPTYDFEQELLSKMGNVEVLSPIWLRDEMKEIIKGMMSNYNPKS